jgi:hypothetical protein
MVGIMETPTPMKPKPRKSYGYINAPIQFERWCSLYLQTSAARKVYNEEDRRIWARRAAQHIMRRFVPSPLANGEIDE